MPQLDMEEVSRTEKYISNFYLKRKALAKNKRNPLLLFFFYELFSEKKLHL